MITIMSPTGHNPPKELAMTIVKKKKLMVNRSVAVWGALRLSIKYATMPPRIEKIIGASHHRTLAFSFQAFCIIGGWVLGRGWACFNGCPQLGHVKAPGGTPLPQFGQRL